MAVALIKKKILPIRPKLSNTSDMYITGSAMDYDAVASGFLKY